MNAIAQTALWMAAVRARETARPDHLFSDPFADALAGTEGMNYLAWAERMAGTSDPHAYNVIRTRVFDDLLVEATDQGIRQIVLVAAGLDTRAYRISWPLETRIYELDQPELMAEKANTLATLGAEPRACLQMLAVDLRQPWTAPIVAAGYDPTTPSAWIVESLLVHLSEANVRDLLGTITRYTAAGSLLGFDVYNEDFLHSSWTATWIQSLEKHGVKWRFGINTPEQLLAAEDWEVVALQPGQPGADFGRWPYGIVPRHVPGIPRAFFIRAKRR